MRALENVFFETQQDFRDWLEQNHDKSPGIWMVYYKKHTGEKCIDYKEALRQALCYGWIDSTVRTLDSEQYLRMFTPRRNTSNWSEVNKKLVHELIQQGIMTEAGLRKIDSYLKTGKVEWPLAEEEPVPVQRVLPEAVMEEFARNEPALSNFNALSKTNKLYFIQWINSAKRPETLQKRVSESIALLKESKKMGLK